MGRSLLMVALLCLSAGLARAEVLISPEEAARPPQAKETKIVTRAIGRAPGVDSKDLAKTASSPLNFTVKFTPHGGAKVDVGTVKVIYLRTPELDLTPRLRKYIDAAGINMPNAEVPPGEHQLRIEFKDTGGRDNPLTVITLTVRPAGA